mmetsp:Transcript_10379/g.15942  ORF Transcript_10379/g.15942 Transcript_10379/m.15942 type:complete len:304 (+) Transcript_10379:322-1233(+)
MLVQVDISPKQQQLLNILPRVAAGVSFCCAVYMSYIILNSRYYRSRIYHRIFLGCSIHIVILNIITFWGSAAVPIGTPHILGAKGTIATCSAQGFIYQISVFVVPLYYAILSFLSYLHIANKVKVEKLMWLEKWVHLGVHFYPITSSIYLLSIQAFNPIITSCWVSNVPMGCGGEYGEICSRGPDNLFRWVDAAMIFGFGTHSFLVTLMANTNGALIGVWVSIIYKIFRSDDPISHSTNDDTPEQVAKQQISEGESSKGPVILCKPEFSIFDGDDIPGDSPWASYLSQGIDLGYEEEDDCVQT